MKSFYLSKILLCLAKRTAQLTIVLFVMTGTQLYAQSNRTIRGTVVDQTGEPLTGASVVYKTGNSSQTPIVSICGVEGDFSLTLPANAKQIEVSFVGYPNLTVILTQQSTYEVTMKSDPNELEGVVVTGMFRRNSRTFTGAVSTITNEELLKSGNQNLIQSLKNLDPSLILIDNLAAGSNPNAMPDLQMRGQSAFPDLKGEYQSNPNQPLFILDGFETSITKIMDLDMNIVESITLLKDATAKAIYGAKAANGVIVIETRRPKEGQIKLTYSGSLNVEIPDLTSYDLTNAGEKLEIERLGGLFYSDNVQTQIGLQQRYDQILKEVLAGVNTDWLVQPIRTGLGQKHSIYLEGGDKSMVYGIDLAYNKIEGVMKASGRDVFNGGISLSYRANKLMFRNKLSITNGTANESPWGAFSEYASMNPYNRIYDDKGKLIQAYQFVNAQSGTRVVETQPNPMWNAMINTKYVSQYTEITNNFYAEWAVQENLKFIARLGITQVKESSDQFKPGTHTDFINYTGDDIYRKGNYTKGNGETMNYSADLGGSYSISKNKHLLYANLQGNVSQNTYDKYYLVAEGFPNDNMDHMIFATQYQKDGSPYGNEGVSRSVGAIGSVNYSYDSRYLFDANYRLTGSSDFGVNTRWGSFWSLGAGWNVEQESFMKDVTFINRLKIRASTGYTGSQGFSTYDAIATLKYYTNTSYNGSIGSYLVGLANPDLKWQRKYDQNIGMDFTVANSRITGRIDYYISTTKGMLTNVTVPESTGFGTYLENMGEVENRGFEAYLNYRVWNQPNTRSYINLYGSVSGNTNKIKKISESLRKYNSDQDAIKDKEDQTDQRTNQTTPSIRYEEGQSMNAIWAVRSMGIDPESGREIFMKKDGTVTFEYSAADQVVCGDMMPKISGNAGLNAEYRNFGLNVALTYRIGGQVYNQTLVDKVENADLQYNVDRRVFTDRWQKSGDMALYKSIMDRSYTRPTSRFVEDYNVLNIASISVSYDFRDFNFVKESFLERLKIQLYLNNLATISSVKIERGTSYPFARNVSFAVQATF